MESGSVDDEEIRPEYETKAREYRVSPISKRREPYIAPSKQAVQYIISGVGVAFVVSNFNIYASNFIQLLIRYANWHLGMF